MLRRRLLHAAEASYDAVVCGGGVVGVACAHYMARDHGLRVLLVDERPPLTYTSSLSTECYRNYWGDHAPMTAFMNHSIDLLEQRAAESDNGFSMSRRGYSFLSRSADGAKRHLEAAAQAERLGLGSGRVLTGADHGTTYRHDLPYDAHADGLSVFSGRESVAAFLSPLPPFVAADVESLMHCGRCGWMNAQQMGTQLLEQAREAGVATRTPARVVGIGVEGGRVSEVRLAAPGGDGYTAVPTGAFVNCAGPFAAEVHRMALESAGGGAPDGAPQLPLRNEIHGKAVLRDVRRAVPSEAPMMIWEDEICLGWEEEEADELRAMGGFEARIADPLPAGAHFRPYPGATPSLLLLWEALHMDVTVPDPPPPEPELRGELFAELMLRGLSRMAPRLGEYVDSDAPLRSHVSIDGGYYTQTPDNLPLIGEAPGGPRGSYVCAGLSGYGVMAANAAGSLLSRHVAGAPLPPEYAEHFAPARWLDRAYRESVEAGAAGKGLQI